MGTNNKYGPQVFKSRGYVIEMNTSLKLLYKDWFFCGGGYGKYWVHGAWNIKDRLYVHEYTDNKVYWAALRSYIRYGYV